MKLNDFNFNKIYDDKNKPVLDIESFSIATNRTVDGTIRDVDKKLYIEFKAKVDKI